MIPKILIIDDDDFLANLLREAFEAEGAEVIVCTDPTKAQSVAEEITPDLILIDVYMEPINGLHVAAKLKRWWKTSDIPLVFVTADASDENVLSAFMVGGVDVVTKPFDLKKIFKRIHPYLGLGRVHNLIKNLIEK